MARDLTDYTGTKYSATTVKFYIGNNSYQFNRDQAVNGGFVVRHPNANNYFIRIEEPNRGDFF